MLLSFFFFIHENHLFFKRFDRRVSLTLKLLRVIEFRIEILLHHFCENIIIVIVIDVFELLVKFFYWPVASYYVPSEAWKFCLENFFM